MTKTIAVVFTPTNARILTNPTNLAELRGKPNVLINPSLELVEGEPPHFWKVQDGTIVPMSRPEKLARLLNQNLNGVNNQAVGVRWPALRKLRALQGPLGRLLYVVLGAELWIWLGK